MVPILGNGFVHVICFKKAVQGAEDHQFFGERDELEHATAQDQRASP